MSNVSEIIDLGPMTDFHTELYSMRGDLLDGKPFDFSELRGKVVLVVNSATL